MSQVPEDCEAVISSPTPQIEAEIREALGLRQDLRVEMRRDGDVVILTARGRSAHSMDPKGGLNAITHLADVLGFHDWPDSQAGRMVRLINDLVGVGDYAEQFGDLAYSHDFMGRLTLTLATVSYDSDDLVAGLSFRRPVGRTCEQIEHAIRSAVRRWQLETGTENLETCVFVKDPYLLEDAPGLPLVVERRLDGLARTVEEDALRERKVLSDLGDRPAVGVRSIGPAGITHTAEVLDALALGRLEQPEEFLTLGSGQVSCLGHAGLLRVDQMVNPAVSGARNVR